MATFSFNPPTKADVNIPARWDPNLPIVGQVKASLESAGSGLAMAEEIALTGQGAPAVVMMAALDGIRDNKIPTVMFYTIPAGDRLIAVDMGEWRHDIVRDYRPLRLEGKAYPGWTVLDGSARGLTPVQMTELAATLGTSEDQFRVINMGFKQYDFG